MASKPMRSMRTSSYSAIKPVDKLPIINGLSGLNKDMLANLNKFNEEN